MPKLNPVAIIAASVAFYLIGFLWYGLIFSDPWMSAHGLTAEDAENQGPIWMLLGFVITLMQVTGLACVLKWKGASGPAAAAMTATVLWALLALPFNGYAYVYLTSHDATLLMIDASHMLVGWIISAIVLSLFK
jgi:hypothetical protein